jgi:glycine betaine/proline transport system permease protein
MVRCTTLALKLVPPEIIESGHMMGCTSWQMLREVLLPSARPMLIVGLNQVIMLSLNMVIIASMIGAGGLGFDVLFSLKRLALGQGLEAGLAITLLAIAIDHLSRMESREETKNPEIPGVSRQMKPFTFLAIVLGILLIPTLLGEVIPAIGNYPKSMTITTGNAINEFVKLINIEYYDVLTSIKNTVLMFVLIPGKKFLISLPWSAVVLLLAFGGFQLGGIRLALLAAALSAFIVITGLWEKAMITVNLCSLSVVLACAIGIPIGIWASFDDRARRIIVVVIDTLQTMPSFVYLIPVVMLFGIGDFPAMIAIVAYAVAPAVRYTDHGIRNVPETVVEAARSMGCTDWQVLWSVQIPIAMPQIMLGVNQTIMMALSMLVIAALVGTSGLGQEVFIALSHADPGKGIVAGLSVAFIAIIPDRIIVSWSSRKKRELGLD